MAYTTYLSDSLQAEVTQVYGNGHLGTDIQFKLIYWSNVCFPKSGTVAVSQHGGTGDLWTYGEWYEVNCSDGTKYRMAHLRGGSRVVGVGAVVTAGQLAGVQGNTGNTTGATGIHLHLEYFVNGARTSPGPLMGFPDAVGTYDITFGGPEPPGPPQPGGWSWGELPQRDTVPRHFEFQATQVESATTINTVEGTITVQPGEWIIQPVLGLCDWKGLWTPRKNVYLEIPEIIAYEGEEPE